MVHLGDLVGGQACPNDADGQEVLDQFLSATYHPREHFYNLLGNHDGSGPNDPVQWWFRKWIDPLGLRPEISYVHPERRPYPVEGTWERYAFEVGNLLFLMMGDRNDSGPPVGRRARGGYPAGKVTLETFQWWKDRVEHHPDRIIITCHHHMLRDTTVASGRWEGVDGGYHGRFEDGAPIGASYLYFVGDQPDAGTFERYLSDHPRAIDLWLGGTPIRIPTTPTGGSPTSNRNGASRS